MVGTTAIGHRDVQHTLQRLQEGASLIRGRLASGNVALLFGSERYGLSNEDFNHCHWLLHIPTRDEHVSMNLGQAVAVCLYELARDEPVQPIVDEKAQASAGEVERMTGVLLEALRASGSTNLSNLPLHMADMGTDNYEQEFTLGPAVTKWVPRRARREKFVVCCAALACKRRTSTCASACYGRLSGNCGRARRPPLGPNEPQSETLACRSLRTESEGSIRWKPPGRSLARE